MFVAPSPRHSRFTIKTNISKDIIDPRYCFCSDELTFEKEVGKGSSARVFRGLLKQETVAIKKMQT